MKKIYPFLLFVFLFLFFGLSSLEASTVQLTDPLGYDNDPDGPQLFIGRVINASLGIVGSLALLMFVYGGFVWMLASGNQERVEKGKNILLWATIGLVVIFSSYVLVNFVISDLIGAS